MKNGRADRRTDMQVVWPNEMRIITTTDKKVITFRNITHDYYMNNNNSSNSPRICNRT